MDKKVVSKVESKHNMLCKNSTKKKSIYTSINNNEINIKRESQLTLDII